MNGNRKKIHILYMVSVIVLMMLMGCAKQEQDATNEIEVGESDLEYVKSKGTLIVGITDFAPMDYRDGDEWTGFDADLTKSFAESIGVMVQFEEINWNQKAELLRNGSIDCIWNGMTRTEELQETISCSDPYLSNAQVIVLRSSEMGQYSTAESCQHLLFAVEEGSTGEKLLQQMRYRFISYPTQIEALQSVHDKKADAAVIDIIMASYYTGNSKEFADLGFDISLNDEVFSVGLRRNSDITGELNTFLKNAYEDGTIEMLAEKYGIESAVLDFADK